MPEHNFERFNSAKAPVFEGLEFVEIATASPQELDRLLCSMGFQATARHRSKSVTLYQQGDINLIINSTPDSFAAEYTTAHGTSICALGLRTPNATTAYQNLIGRGAWEAATSAGAMELNIPAIESIGGTQIYLIDRYAGDISIYDIDFKTLSDQQDETTLLSHVGALSLTVELEREAPWRDFFRNLFGFKVTRDNLIQIDGRTNLLLETADRPGSADERIDSITFVANDLSALKRHLEEQSVSLREVDDQSGKYEVVLPLSDQFIRIFIAR
ncbi:4-hydroxyphenylpyruvate dioxygenase [Marinobacterium lacunae]|uniref:4-hydroxyphenylpyruvate dioxygenase n=1 Tax=Marinobacterium lacunae TaxID=1232683 RepID=A0A081FUW3_9GAMM|nr:hypothetical protein [Marinobacterium lacunae]KEA62318.1 4-hydroxyphenylpyruvate dioxygenase [Marinobacterium lacunae]